MLHGAFTDSIKVAISAKTGTIFDGAQSGLLKTTGELIDGYVESRCHSAAHGSARDGAKLLDIKIVDV